MPARRPLKCGSFHAVMLQKAGPMLVEYVERKDVYVNTITEYAKIAKPTESAENSEATETPQ